MTVSASEKSLYLLILVGYLLLGTLFATRTPAWQAPDEPAHYNYIQQVASGTLIPVIQAGDWDNAYLEQLKAERFKPELLDKLDTVRYENHQPPLYYWLGAIVYLFTGGSLTALRLYSVALGLGTLLITARIAGEIFPKQATVRVAALALVAFVPQHIAILASVNNDALALLFIALTLWLCLRYVRGDERVTPLHLGLGVGLIFITKTTGYFMAGVVLLALYWRWQQIRGAFRVSVKAQTSQQLPDGTRRVYTQSDLTPLFGAIGQFALIAGVFALFWWGRNVAVYGFPDFLGLRAHDAVVVGQLRTTDLVADIGTGDYLSRAISTTFNSFWGQFGWMGVPMRDVPVQGSNLVYVALLLICIAGLVGLFMGESDPFMQPTLRVPEKRPAPTDLITARDKRRILQAVTLLTVLMFLYYNTSFVQWQGRYLFPALIPVALWLAAGVDNVQRRYLAAIPRAYWLTTGIFALLALLDLYLIWRVLPGALGY